MVSFHSWSEATCGSYTVSVCVRCSWLRERERERERGRQIDRQMERDRKDRQTNKEIETDEERERGGRKN